MGNAAETMRQEATYVPLCGKWFRCNWCGVKLKKKQLQSHSLGHNPNPAAPKKPKRSPISRGIVMAYGDDRSYFDCPVCRSEVHFIDMTKMQTCKSCGQNFRVSKASEPRRSFGYYW